MYLRPVCELPGGRLWTYEAKLDGYRCLATKRSVGVVLWSRCGTGSRAGSRRLPGRVTSSRRTRLSTVKWSRIGGDGRVSFNAAALTVKRATSSIPEVFVIL